MRVNHSGEICAQALYEGQASVARSEKVKKAMLESAKEETDHLNWCAERVAELGEKTSVLNPLWYGLSYGVGVSMGLLGDKWSLGFIAATEEGVCKHLQSHQRRLPQNDLKSKAIISEMEKEERTHGTKAFEYGGVSLPSSVKFAMNKLAKVMTSLSYYG